MSNTRREWALFSHIYRLVHAMNNYNLFSCSSTSPHEATESKSLDEANKYAFPRKLIGSKRIRFQLSGTALRTAISVFAIFSATFAVFPFLFSNHVMSSQRIESGVSGIGYDFNLRYNEVRCVLEGLDPYQVWHGDTTSNEWYSYNGIAPKTPSARNPVNAYPPWSYALMMPLALLPKRLAWTTYLVIEFLGIALFACVGFRTASRTGGGTPFWNGIFGASSALWLGPCWNSLAWTGNWGIIIGAAMVSMVVCLHKGFDLAAGLCFAIMFIKPQIGIPFVIPLLLLRKWKTLAIFALIIMLATCISATFLQMNPLSLVLQIPKYGSDVANGCRIIPNALFSMTKHYVGLVPAMLLGALVALIVFSSLMFKVRRCRSLWPVFSLAALCSLTWTYCKDHDEPILSFVSIGLACVALGARQMMIRRVSIVALLVCGLRAFMFFHVKQHPTAFSRLSLNVIGGISGKLLAASFLGAFWIFVLGTVVVCLYASKEDDSALPFS